MQNVSSTIRIFKQHSFKVLLVSLFFISCKKELLTAPPTSPVLPSALRAQFSADAFSLAENAGETSYQLSLSSSALKAETITITVTSATAQYGRDFTTLPAASDGIITIPVEQGKQDAQLKVFPVNNNLKDGDRELEFTITAEGTIKPDSRNTAKVTLADDDTKASIAFAVANASVNETRTAGYVAELLITPMAFSNGFSEISMVSASAVYGTHFTTEPAAVNGKIRVQVNQHQSKVSFKIKPINDAVTTAAKNINFQLSSTSGDLEAGAQKQLSFSIADDDVAAPAITSIASIRNSFTGTSMYFFTEKYVSGIVTSVNDNISPAVAYIQDAGGGIALRFSSSHQLLPGEVVRLDLQGSLITEQNGVLEIQQLHPSAVVKVGWDILVVPSTTITQLYNTPGNKEGQLVMLTNVTFTDANGTATLQGERTISDGIRTATVRTESFASFRNRVIPAGQVSVTGILIEENGRYIILPLTSESIR
jgi:hypothetical protein